MGRNWTWAALIAAVAVFARTASLHAQNADTTINPFARDPGPAPW